MPRRDQRALQELCAFPCLLAAVEPRRPEAVTKQLSPSQPGLVRDTPHQTLQVITSVLTINAQDAPKTPVSVTGGCLCSLPRERPPEPCGERGHHSCRELSKLTQLAGHTVCSYWKTKFTLKHLLLQSWWNHLLSQLAVRMAQVFLSCNLIRGHLNTRW